MLHPLWVTQQYCLTSMAAWLSSISHHSLLPHIPSIRLFTVNSSARLGLFHNPLTLAPSHCPVLGTRFPVWGMYGCSKDCLILISFRLPEISCFTLSFKCFSSDSNKCSTVGIGPLLQFPHWLRTGPVLLTLLFFPLVPFSHRVLRSSVYSFPLVKYYCLLSAGVLHALLCLKVYS